MSTAISRVRRAGGFTLMEVLFALSIVGTALFVLVSAHQTALNLHVTMEEQVVLRGFLDQSVGLAEIGVLSGELSGGGEFGSRNPEYSWSYEGAPVSEESQYPLYHVTVFVRGPESEETVEFLVFDGNAEEGAQSSNSPQAPSARPAANP